MIGAAGLWPATTAPGQAGQMGHNPLATPFVAKPQVGG
jgi:hypothetical protein